MECIVYPYKPSDWSITSPRALTTIYTIYCFIVLGTRTTSYYFMLRMSSKYGYSRDPGLDIAPEGCFSDNERACKKFLQSKRLH